jgi:hypothetical protein
MSKSFLKLWFPLTLLIFVHNTTTFAQSFLAPGDNKYLVTSDGFYRYIYPENLKNRIHDIIGKNNQIREVYEKEFKWNLDSEPVLIITSPKNQIANGFATVLPRIETVFYGGGVELNDRFAIQSWLGVLLAHETAHLYQLNTKDHWYSQFLQRTFKASGLGILPPFTYTMYPNLFLPDFILEGNATYNEGRFGNGGRLYSGYAKALLLSLMKESLVSSKSLLNNDLNFPYGEEAYMIGGFLQNDLAERTSTESVNQYFLAHSDKIFVPITINEAFYRQYGEPYQRSIAHLYDRYADDAQKQTRSSQKSILTTQFLNPMTRVGNFLFIQTSDGVTQAKTFEFNVTTQKLKRRKGEYSKGRVFQDDKGNLVVSASERYDSTSTRYALYEKGYRPIKGSENKIYFHFDGKNELYGMMQDSYDQISLWQDGRKLGPSASSAILNGANDPIYFRQNKKSRQLVQGKQIIFEYDGYYGFPVDADDAAHPFFVASTPLGSGLFVVRDGKSYRAHPSDAIVDAKLIDDETALICEITANGFEYKIDKLTFTQNIPHFEKFKFENEQQFSILENFGSATPTSVEEKPESKQIKSQPYRGLSNMSYLGTDPYVFFGSEDLIGGLAFRFADPLQQHQISVSSNYGDYGKQDNLFLYQNSVSRTTWSLAFGSSETVELEQDLSPDGYRVFDRFQNYFGLVGFTFPFWQRAVSEFSFSSYFTYDYSEKEKNYLASIREYRIQSVLAYDRLLAETLSLFPRQTTHIEIAHDEIAEAQKWNNAFAIYGTAVRQSIDVWKQTLVSANFQYAKVDGPVGALEFGGLSGTVFPSSTTVTNNTSTGDVLDLFEVQKIDFQISQGFILQYYVDWFPVGLRRVAPFIAFSEYAGSTQQNKSSSYLFNEKGSGLYAELLLVHRFPFVVTYSNYESSDGKSSEGIGLAAKMKF